MLAGAMQADSAYRRRKYNVTLAQQAQAADPSTASIEHRGCDREVRAKDVPQAVELTRPHDDQELNRDSDMRPTFSGHVEKCSWTERGSAYQMTNCTIPS